MSRLAVQLKNSFVENDYTNFKNPRHGTAPLSHVISDNEKEKDDRSGDLSVETPIHVTLPIKRDVFTCVGV